MPLTYHADFQAEAEEKAGVLSLAGRISYHQAPHLRASLFEAIDNTRTSHLLVDLAEVEAMDTASLAVLVEGLIATEGKGPEIFLCAPSESVRRIFRLAGLNGALAQCRGCRDDARRAIAD